MTKDMTEGPITSQLVGFTIPLVLGNLFQMMYNAVDSMIVGRFVGKEALAAVGTCNPVMTLMVLIMNGLCLGAGILMGTQYGAKDYAKLRRQISTSMLAGAVFCAAVSVLCIVFAGPILGLLQVSSSIMDLTKAYFRIISTGLVFTFLYNFFASTLRALGDSRTPLYFLVASSVLNIFGDLFFVTVLRWGSSGCAISTVVSEAVCCALCILYIQKKVEILRLGKDWLVFDGSLLGQTLAYGWTSAAQQGVVQLGKVAIQALANTMGVSVAAAFAVVNRIDDFAYTPEQNISHAMTAFMAQNRGAKKTDRMQAGFRSGLFIEVVYATVVFAICFLFREPLMRLFNSDSEVVGHGMRYLALSSFMYYLPAVTNCIQGYFRGIGDLRVTLISSFVNMGVRVLGAALMILVFSMSIEALPWSNFLGWAGMLIVELPLLIRTYGKEEKLKDSN